MEYKTIQHTGNRRSQFFFMGERFALNPGQSVRVPVHEAHVHLKKHADLFIENNDLNIEPLFDWDKLDTLKGIWGDSPVFIVAGGPSVKRYKIEQLKHIDCKTIAVNHSFDFWPWMDAVVFQDEQFLTRSTGDIDSYNGIILTRRATGYQNRDNTYFFPTNKDKVARSFQEGLFSPLSSGIVALNAALLMSTGKIYLLGYDMTGRHFYPDDYHDSIIDYDTDSWVRAIKLYDKFKDYRDRVFNLSEDSKIEVFDKVVFDGLL